MANKNKNKHNQHKPQQETTKSTNIPVDKSVWELVKKTAERNNVSEKALVALAIDAMMGSLETYGYSTEGMTAERNATVGTGDVPVAVGKENFQRMNKVGVYFGVRMTDLLRDSIIAQRFNWQRLQAVNARSMNSIRLHMFELEQLGPKH